MESQQRSDHLRAAMKDTFRVLFDSLRSELEPEIKTFNSKLFSKGVISQDIRKENSIETTLSAIMGRLENEESTFEDVRCVLWEISSKKHLSKKLQDTLRQKMKDAGYEEMVYLTPQTSISASVMAGEGFFVPNVSSGGSPAYHRKTSIHTVAPSTPLSQGTWPSRSVTEDSARTSSLSSVYEDSEEEKIRAQPTDGECVDVPVLSTASGTIPDSALSHKRSSIEMRHEMLEEEVTRLEQRVQQLDLEKNNYQQMLLKKTSEASELNAQLSTSLTNLKQREEVVKTKEEEVKSLRQQLTEIKENQMNMERILTQKLVQQEEMTRNYKRKSEDAEEKARKFEQRAEDAEEKAQKLEQRAEDAEEKAAKSENRVEEAEEEARKYKQMAEETEEKARKYKQKAEEAEEKAQKYKQKAEDAEHDTEVARQNITKFVSAIERRKDKIHAMEEELDSLESQTSATESDSDSKQPSSDQDS